MKYWTVFGLGKTRRNRGWQVENRFPFKIGGTPEDDEVDKAYVLVGPEEQDLLALKNAALYPLNDRVTVAFSPAVADASQYVFPIRRYDSNIDYKEWFKDNSFMNYSLVRDGKHVSMCEGCSKLIQRAVGGCVIGSKNCDRKFFHSNARMHEPKGQYIPVDKCCMREAFSSYTIFDLCTEDPVELLMQDKKQDARSTISAVLTKQMNQLSCSVCLFGHQNNDKRWSCGASYRKARWCQGPFFPSDIPEPRPEQRIAVRLMGQSVPVARYKELAEMHGWAYKNWKRPPDIEIGYCHQGFKKEKGDVPLILRQMPNRTHRLDELTKEEDWPTVEAEFVRVRPVPIRPPTVMEKLLIYLLSTGSLYHGDTRGFGYSSHLSSAVYRDRSDTVELMWSLNTFSYSRTCSTPMDLYCHSSRSSFEQSRGGQILDIMSERKLGSTVERDTMRKVLQELVAAEKAGLPLPGIKETYEKLAGSNVQGVLALE